jgi:hypothetical protein
MLGAAAGLFLLALAAPVRRPPPPLASEPVTRL